MRAKCEGGGIGGRVARDKRNVIELRLCLLRTVNEMDVAWPSWTLFFP